MKTSGGLLARLTTSLFSCAYTVLALWQISSLRYAKHFDPSYRPIAPVVLLMRAPCLSLQPLADNAGALLAVNRHGVVPPFEFGPNLVSRSIHHIAFSKLPFCDGVLVRIPALTFAHCDVLRP